VGVWNEEPPSGGFLRDMLVAAQSAGSRNCASARRAVARDRRDHQQPFAAFLRMERATWGRLIKQADMHPE
jgi:hypothetical protein